MSSVAPSGPQAHERLPVIAVGMLLMTTALMMTYVQPILLGALAQNKIITEAGLGQIAMAETLCLAVGSTVGPFWMNSGSMRLKVVLACLGLAASNFAVLAAREFATILLLRCLCGAFEGLILGAATLTFAHNRQPARLNGLSWAIVSVPQGLATYGLPALLIPRWGAGAGFAMMAILALLAAGASAICFVDRIDVPRTSSSGHIAWSAALVLVLIASLLFNAAVGAAWNYLEELGVQIGVSPRLIGASFSASIVFQALGALAAAWLASRLPTRMALIVQCCLSASILITMSDNGRPLAFIVGACTFGAIWLAIQPFQLTEFVRLDPSRRVAPLVAPLAVLGFCVGPLVGSFAVKSHDVLGAFWLAGAMMLGAGTLYAIAAVLARLDESRRKKKAKNLS
jgi:MFS transporter, DHA1 family, inner membrane transport protein